MSTFRLPIHPETESGPRLAVRLDRAEKPRHRRLCVLYCHGFASSQGGDKADFFRQRFLHAGLSVCSFDFRGHGESGGSMRDLSLTRCLEDVEAVHRHLRREGSFEQILLFGSSMGGGVAFWYASRHPESVACAVAIAPALEMHEGLLRRLGPEKAQEWREKGSILFEHELGGYELSWNLIKDLRGYSRSRLAKAYGTPSLIFQGVLDESVSWRAVADFVAGTDAKVHMHLMADGDHRLIDRLPFLWRMLSSFLAAEGVLANS
ncbi:MAG: alpha/beta fold hydrolase [Acidobacteriota bacterium]